MLEIDDSYVLSAYLLCIGSAVLCVIYGLINWNRGEDTVAQEDIRWAEQEEKVEEEL